MARDRVLKIDQNEAVLVLDSEVVRKVEEKRGEMSRSEFLNSLIDGQMKEDTNNQSYVSKEEFYQFEQGIKKLLQNFLDFFLSYGLELGKPPQDKTFEELNQKLETLAGSDNKAKNPTSSA